MKIAARKLALMLPLTLVAAPGLFSQSIITCPPQTKFHLRGIVGGAELGARVVLKDFKTGHSRAAVTDECGRYAFSDVTPATTYEISASYGLHTSLKHRVSLMFSTDKTVVFDFSMPNSIVGWCATGHEHCREDHGARN